MQKLLLVAIIFLTTMLYSQPVLLSYKTNGKVMETTISFEQDNISFRAPGNSTLGYFDESKPGKFAIPNRLIALAVPKSSKFQYNYSALSSSKININIGLNPLVTKASDSTLSYEWNYKVAKDGPSELVVYKGTQVIDDYYCAIFEVNPYEYDDVNKVLTTQKQVKLNLTFDTDLPQIDASKIVSDVQSSLIINKNYADNLQSKQSNILFTDTTGGWIDYNREYVKMGITQDGVYRVYSADLIKMGVDIQSIKPSTFKIYNYGVQIPYYLHDKTATTFDTTNYIEFVGFMLPGSKQYREVSTSTYYEYKDRYTDTNAYWLTWGGADGLKVNEVYKPAMAGFDTLYSYTHLIHWERNDNWDFNLEQTLRREKPFWCENKTWNYGPVFEGKTEFKQFNVSNLALLGNATVYYKIQDYATNIQTNSHQLAISINANTTLLNTTNLNKYQLKVIRTDFSPSLLNNGLNSVFISNIKNSTTTNITYLDWIELEYPRVNSLVNDSLYLSLRNNQTTGIRNISVKNIFSDSVIVWKYGTSIEKIYLNIANGSTVFADEIDSSNTYAFLPGKNIAKPLMLNKKKFVSLRSSANQSDYILITHKNFLTTGKSYVDFIASAYNVTAKLVDVEDIYDQFYYGIFSPESIKMFLQATNAYWATPKPRYCFLVGSANYDYYGNKARLGAPRKPNYVPSYGASVSDSWYAIWDTTTIPTMQMSIGRLPVQEDWQFKNYLARHQNYVQAPYTTWNKKFIFFSGGASDNIGQIQSFKDVNNLIATTLVTPMPRAGEYKHFFKTVDPQTNFGLITQSEFDNTINSGSLVIAYLGHSGTQTWDNSITDPYQLKNKVTRSPFISDFGCSTARFAEPDVTAFSELFVLGNDGQAIGYIGNSSLGFISTSTAFPPTFYKKILQDTVFTIGDAHRIAKNEFFNLGKDDNKVLFSYTNTLIADPILKLKIPSKPNLSIEPAGVTLMSKDIKDNDDSLEVKIAYFNTGKGVTDTADIIVEDWLGANLRISSRFRRVVPLLTDTITLRIPVLGAVGEHTLKVKINPNGIINEIYNTDNAVSVNYTVASTSVRTVLPYRFENMVSDTLILLNPMNSPGAKQFKLEISDSLSFSNLVSYPIEFGKLFTKFSLNNLLKNRRYFYRYKDVSAGITGPISSFYYGSEKGYGIIDSVGLAMGTFTNTSIYSDRVKLDNGAVSIGLVSAGYNDGNTAIITRNGQNLIPENTIGGHHVAIFDAKTFDFIAYKRFEVSKSDTSIIGNYKRFLDTIGTNRIVVFAISDEGRISDQVLKSKIKAFGSRFIDSLQFRSSWGLIGWRGASSNQVLEKFSPAFSGRIHLDSAITKTFTQGEYISSVIGPASNWNNCTAVIVNSGNSRVEFLPIGLRVDGAVDTLSAIAPDQNGSFSLSSLQATIYPKIKLLIKYYAGTNGESSEIKSIKVHYSSPAELGINYQTVSLSDTIIKAGNVLTVKVEIGNIGETEANGFNVKVENVNSDNTREIIYETKVDTIKPLGTKTIGFSYVPMGGTTSKSVSVSVDPESKIYEILKDNNYYSSKFTVINDTIKARIDCTIDNKEILDGDYIVSTPKIKIDLYDPSIILIQDTSYIKVFMDDEPLSYVYGDLIPHYNVSNPKMSVMYSPTLADGEHYLKVLVKNNLGNFIDSTAYTRQLLVDSKSKLLTVRNYPNPFSGSTYFTFILTNTVESVKIKIFTIAGREIKEITVPGSSLTLGFNKVFWDGRDADGDLIANGTYLYKLIMSNNGKTESVIEKLVIVR